MKFIKKRAIYVIIALSILCAGEANGGKLYKWVDRDGVVHFSDRLPGKTGELNAIIQENELTDVSPAKPQETPATRPVNENPVKYATKCAFTIKGRQNIGTGFFISSNGYAITCKHVIEESPDHTAILDDQSEFPIGVISTSENHDLALVLVITSKKTEYLSLRNHLDITPGERVFAVGSSVGLQSTVTDGVLTGLRKKMPGEEKVIQFSAPINPGNSGGPLIDEKGSVIGVVSWKIISNKGLPVSGVGFAIPSGYLLEEYGPYVE